MTQADCVFNTPPTNTSANNLPEPVDMARRHVLAVAAAGAVAVAIPIAAGATELPPPDGFERVLDHQGRVWFKADGMPDPAFALIAEKLAADIAHCEAIDVLDEAEDGSDAADEAYQRCCVAGSVVNEADWRLATTPPTTLAGVAAVLRFANEIEDGGMEWPNTDTVGRDGWHYEFRATMAAAIETIMCQKAVRS